MPGYVQRIPTQLTDDTLPRFADEPILGPGSLMLIDPAHPMAAWASGVPASGTVLPNLAQTEAKAVLGATKDVAPKYRHPASFTGNAGLMERTGKGALHGISPQGGTAVLQSGPAIYLPLDLISYLLANPTNDIYISLWFRITRANTASSSNNMIFSVSGNGQQTNSYLAHLGVNSGGGGNYITRPVDAANVKVLPDGPLVTTGEKRLSTFTTGWYTSGSSSLPGDGTNTTVTGNHAAGGIGFGSTTGVPGIGKSPNGLSSVDANIWVSGSANKDHAVSHIFRRLYMEDLTVSGRTYAQVDAIESAEYTKQVLTVGGRYYNDTFTSPSTLP